MSEKLPIGVATLDLVDDDASRPKSSTQRVYRDLRKQIITGAIEPGERLKVESLKTMLDAGGTPIREALSLLTSDQLVERLDQRGFRAASANREHFEEILGLRCQLDTIALQKSIENGDKAWEESLVLANHRLNQCDLSDTDTYEECHKVFHMTLIAACGSAILIRFCDQLYDLNIRYRFMAGKTLRYKKRDIGSEHQQIVDAAIARDVALVTERLLNHYNRTGEYLSELIK